MTYCKSTIIVKGDQTVKKAVSLRCRAWTCPDCAEQRKAQLTAQAIRGDPTIFLTLTSRRQAGQSPEDAARALASAWRVVRKRALREAKRDPRKTPIPFGAAPPDGWPQHDQKPVPNQVKLQGGELEFICVVEKHRSGWPHLHLCIRARWIDQAWLSAQMRDIINSPVVWIERINNKSKIAGYVAKYCTKAAEKIGTCKRYWQSKKYQLRAYCPKKRDDAIPGRWERDTMTLSTWVAMWRGWDWRVDQTDQHTAIAQAPPE